MEERVARTHQIADRVSKIDGVTASVRGNRRAGVVINCDTRKVGITGAEATRLLWTAEPRIATGGGAGWGTISCWSNSQHP